MQSKPTDAIRSLIDAANAALDDGAAFRDADTEWKLSAAARDASAALQSVDALVGALRTIASDPMSVQLDPQWAVRIARNALASIDAADAAE
jgi:hypothetical protein